MDCAALRYTGTHYYIYARERVCVRTPIAKGKGCLGWCVEMERGFWVLLGRWALEVLVYCVVCEGKRGCKEGKA